MSEAATFLATLPPILSALRFSGDGGLRVMFDVPESEMAEAVKLLAWRQQVLRVTVEPDSGRATDENRRRQTTSYL